MIEHDLLDELRLWVHPIVLGRGQKLFPEGFTARFALADTTVFDHGGVVLSFKKP